MPSGEHLYKHGLSGTKLYDVYKSIVRRTSQPNSQVYAHYGGRGITLCEEWKGAAGLKRFTEWAYTNGYKEGLTIDRKDVNGNYEPSNCRWVTMRVQSNNKRNNKVITHNGMTMTVSEWSRYLGGHRNLVANRINKGWDPVAAVSTPPDSSKRH